jgi:small subunit ribosomal protein S17
MPKRVLSGTIVSDKPDKTVVVRVERRVKHPLYGKIIRLSKKYHAHDQDNSYREGEQVRIQECAPISKLKTWSVIDRIGAAKAATVEIVEGATADAEAAAAAPAPKKASKKPAVAEAPAADTVEEAPAETGAPETVEEAPAAEPEAAAETTEEPKAVARKAPAKRAEDKASADKAPAKKAKADDSKGKKAKS